LTDLVCSLFRDNICPSWDELKEGVPHFRRKAQDAGAIRMLKMGLDMLSKKRMKNPSAVGECLRYIDMQDSKQWLPVPFHWISNWVDEDVKALVLPRVDESDDSDDEEEEEEVVVESLLTTKRFKQFIVGDAKVEVGTWCIVHVPVSKWFRNDEDVLVRFWAAKIMAVENEKSERKTRLMLHWAGSAKEFGKYQLLYLPPRTRGGARTDASDEESDEDSDEERAVASESEEEREEKVEAKPRKRSKRKMTPRSGKKTVGLGAKWVDPFDRKSVVCYFKHARRGGLELPSKVEQLLREEFPTPSDDDIVRARATAVDAQAEEKQPRGRRGK
jgi:hypothetical protein